MFDNLTLFSSDDKSSFQNLFNKNLQTAFLFRFFISCIIWNWKFILMLFSIKEKNIMIGNTHVNSITWVLKNYPDCQYTINHLLIYPALTATAAFLVLECFNIANFFIKKSSWRACIAIVNFIEKRVKVTTKTYYDLKEIITIKESELANQLQEKHELSLDIATLNKRITMQESIIDAQQEEILKYKKAEGDANSNNYFAKSAYEVIKKTNNQKEVEDKFQHLIAELKNGDKIRVLFPDQIFLFLVGLKLFEKIETSRSEYRLTSIGKEFINFLMTDGNYP